MENSLEKGKSMPIGTITNGFKKIAEGKWRKVSEHGKTKEEHIDEADKLGVKLNRNNDLPTDSKKYYLDEAKKHSTAASKLDSKEYSDVDVVGKEKEEDYSKEYSRGDKIVVGKLSMTVTGFTDDGRMKIQNNQGENFTLTKDQTKKYVEADRNRSGKAASRDDRSKVFGDNPIGTIRNGFKKIAEGKWRKVSEHGMTKEEHQKETDKFLDAQLKNDTFDTRLASERSYNKWKNSNLDDKEYSDVDVLGEEEKEEYDKEWVNSEINKIKTALKSVTINPSQGDLKRSEKIKKIILNISDFPKPEKLAFEKELKKLGLDINGNKLEIDKSVNDDIEKALVTLEIGYLAGQVSEEQIQKARKTAKNG